MATGIQGIQGSARAAVPGALQLLTNHGRHSNRRDQQIQPGVSLQRHTQDADTHPIALPRTCMHVWYALASASPPAAVNCPSGACLGCIKSSAGYYQRTLSCLWLCSLLAVTLPTAGFVYEHDASFAACAEIYGSGGEAVVCLHLPLAYHEQRVTICGSDETCQSSLWIRQQQQQQQ